MPESPDFHQLHQTSHRRLVLEAIALTGDPAAAGAGVRDAFVAASRQWDRISKQNDPQEWLRNRAWTMAHRRHLARPWHREEGITPEQSVVLRGLQQLTDPQRRSLLLHHLAEQDLPAIARELGATESQCAQLLHDATESYVRATGFNQATLRESLDLLEPLAARVELPTVEEMQRTGKKHRFAYTAMGSLAAIGVFLGAGYLVSTGHASPVLGAQDDTNPVTQSMLLNEQQLAPLSPAQPWAVNATNDNTGGTGLNSICQTERFADKSGLGTLVRKFSTQGVPARTLVETVEISQDTARAKKAYLATRAWFADCQAPRLRLLNTWHLPGLGDEAELMTFQLTADSTIRRMTVGLARDNTLTVSMVAETENGNDVDPQVASNVLAQALKRLCKSSAAGDHCQVTPTLEASNPPPASDAKGFLAVVDLPAVAAIQFPWMASDLLAGEPNVASTPCDNTSFVKAGATHAQTRSYLIPQAGLPARFGITETVAEFPNPAGARQTINGVFAKMGNCEKDLLGSKVTQARIQQNGPNDTQYGLWRVESQINDKQETVQWWMGITRVGNYLAQINFAPIGANDINQNDVIALVERARDRLHELTPAEPAPTPTPQPEKQKVGANP